MYIRFTEKQEIVGSVLKVDSNHVDHNGREIRLNGITAKQMSDTIRSAIAQHIRASKIYSGADKMQDGRTVIASVKEAVKKAHAHRRRQKPDYSLGRMVKQFFRSGSYATA